MDVRNLAIVFSPNIVYNCTKESRPEMILMHMEWNNELVDKLLTHVDLIF